MSALAETLSPMDKLAPALADKLGSTVIFFSTGTSLSTSWMKIATYWSVRGFPSEVNLGSKSAYLIEVMLKSSLAPPLSISLTLSPST